MASRVESWRYWWDGERFIYADGRIEAEVKAGKSVQPLPYPTEWAPDGMPGFCTSPSKCAGHTACPHNPACTE